LRGCFFSNSWLLSLFFFRSRYFRKSSSLDPKFAASWIGFGHAFAAQGESEQAMAAYRTSCRLFKGCHIPVLHIGIEYLYTKNVALASQFIKQSKVSNKQQRCFFIYSSLVSYPSVEIQFLKFENTT
jgi:anaphase-promoting complex subunit 6